MRPGDTPLIAWQDLPASLGLLSRLPVPVDTDRATARGAAASWAYPVAGLVLGSLAALAGTLVGALTGAPVVAALVALLTITILTGAMHEDGLADSADGLWGGWDKARRLDIMKDSRIGTYGVLALVGGFALRGTALSLLALGGHLGLALLIAAPLSRAVMPVLMAALPNARDGGLSKAVGRPSAATAGLGLLLGALPLLFAPAALVPALMAAGLAALAIALIARAKIGGQTGDILGAAQQGAEIAVLLALLAVL